MSQLPAALVYIAGCRVNLLLASSGCAPDCTRRPAPGFCPYDFARGEFLYKDDCNLFQLSMFRKNECKDNKK